MGHSLVKLRSLWRATLIAAGFLGSACTEFSAPAKTALSFNVRLGVPDTLSVTDVASLETTLIDSNGQTVTNATIIAQSSDTMILSLTPRLSVIDSVIKVQVTARSAGVVNITLSVEGGIGVTPVEAYSKTVVVTERWTTVSVGALRACGVTANARAFCWGNGSNGLGDGSLESSSRPVEVLTEARLSGVSVGPTHICVTEVHGFPYCWGLNKHGEIGDATQLRRVVPVPVATGTAFDALTAGDNFSCGVTTSGETYCWGDAGLGELGNGNVLGGVCLVLDTDHSYVCSLNPTVPAMISNARTSELTREQFCTFDSSIFTQCKVLLTAIAAGKRFACGLTQVGAALCWGNAQFVAGPVSGPLCNDGPCSSLATLAGGGTDWAISQIPYAGPFFVSLSAGGQTCALEQGGRAFCWGVDTFVPTPVATALRFSSISVGASHVCGLTTDGVAYCWGTNGAGELGTGSVGPTQPAPAAVAGQRRYSSISAGESSTCAVSIAGPLYCWGQGSFGQLGTGEMNGSPTPVRVLEPQR
jgi:alpha-tubulin suppressor-like RCC1 family protein